MKKRSKAGTLLKMLGLVKPLTGFMCLAVLTGTLGYLGSAVYPDLRRICGASRTRTRHTDRRHRKRNFLRTDNGEGYILITDTNGNHPNFGSIVRARQSE